MTGLEDALGCLRRDLGEEKYVVDFGMQHKLQWILSDYIDEETNFDPQEHKISRITLLQRFQDTVLEVAEETHEVDDPDLDTIFQRKKREVLRDTLGSDLRQFTVVFPLNLRESKSIPDTFSTPGADFERISEDKWRDGYEQPALDADETSLEAFLDESPNDLYANDGVGGLFTFWKTEYESRDYHYALSRVPEIIRLLLGKLNFVTWQWSLGSQPARNTRPPNARFSQLR
ncbi:hypothetical protein [Haladaptatus sp. NG-WS-4]